MTPNLKGQLTEDQRRLLVVLNQVFDVEKKLQMHGDPHNIQRNINRIKDTFEELGLFYVDPTGEAFQETRTDIEASISGTGTNELKIVDVIKPIIRLGERRYSVVAQKGIAIVEAATKANGD